MQTIANPLVNVYQTQLDASRRFADAIFSGTEKIDRVMLDAIHRIFNQQLKLVQAMANVRDPGGAATTLQASFLSRNPDETISFQKEIMRIFAEMQDDFGRSLQEYVAQLGADAAIAATPLGPAHRQAGDTVYNPMSSMFSAWESAFREVAELAKKNMVAVRSQMEDAAGRTMDSAASFTTAATNSAVDAATVAGRAASLAGRSASATDNEDDAGDRRGSTSGGRK